MAKNLSAVPQNLDEFAKLSEIFSESFGKPETPLAGAKAPGKLTEFKKGKLLLGACRDGNLAQAKELVELHSASLFCQEAAWPRWSPLTCAVCSPKNNPDLVLYLLDKGALPVDRLARQPESGQSLSSAQKQTLAWEACSMIANHMDTPSMLAAGETLKKAGYKTPTLDEWFKICLGFGHFAKAAVFFDMGARPMSLEQTDKIFNAFAGWNKPSGTEHQSCCKLLEALAPSMPSEQIAQLYSIACASDDSPLLMSLFKSKTKPSEDWQAPRARAYYYSSHASDDRCSILVTALGKKNENCANMILKIPFIVENLKNDPPSPEAISELKITSLMQLADLGVCLDKQNSKGENLLHLWANADGYDPRNGWATLARKFPSLLSQRNNAGKTPLDIQVETMRKCDPEAAEKFEKSLARSESMGLAAQIKKNPPPQKTKKPGGSRL